MRTRRHVVPVPGAAGTSSSPGRNGSRPTTRRRHRQRPERGNHRQGGRRRDRDPSRRRVGPPHGPDLARVRVAPAHPRALQVKEARMPTDPRTVATECLTAWTTGDLDRTALLDEDVTFTGPLASTEGADDYMTGIDRMSAIVTRADQHEVIVDGDDVASPTTSSRTIRPPPSRRWAGTGCATARSSRCARSSIHDPCSAAPDTRRVSGPAQRRGNCVTHPLRRRSPPARFPRRRPASHRGHAGRRRSFQRRKGLRRCPPHPLALGEPGAVVAISASRRRSEAERRSHLRHATVANGQTLQNDQARRAPGRFSSAAARCGCRASAPSSPRARSPWPGRSRPSRR